MVLLRLLLLGNTEHQPFLIQMNGTTDRPIKTVSKQALRHRAAVTWLFFVIPLSYKHWLQCLAASEFSTFKKICSALLLNQPSPVTRPRLIRTPKKSPSEKICCFFIYFLPQQLKVISGHCLGKAQVFRKVLLNIFLNHHKSLLFCRESPYAFMAEHTHTLTAWLTLP